MGLFKNMRGWMNVGQAVADRGSLQGQAEEFNRGRMIPVLVVSTVALPVVSPVTSNTLSPLRS